ncbi:MAG: leucine-rich repeat domain-containing protein [Candidatus Odinarchaeota archaeon]
MKPSVPVTGTGSERMVKITLKGISNGRDITIKVNSGTRVEISGKKLQAIDLSPLQQCKELQQFDLTFNRLSAIDLSPLQQCKELRYINLSYNQLSAIDLSPLQQCKELGQLHLSYSQLSAIDLSPLQQCKELQVITLSGNRLSAIDLSPLQQCKKLEKLHLKQNPLQTVNISPLMKIKGLKMLKVDPGTRLTASRIHEGNDHPLAINSLKNRIEWILSREEARVQTRVEVLKILQKVAPNVPTQLSRIAELAKQQVTGTEEIIRSILQEHPALGRYHDFEQVFIKEEAVQDEIDKLLQRYETMESRKAGKFE